MLIGIRVDAEALGYPLLVREEVGRHGADDARDVDQAAGVYLVKVLRRLVQRLVVRWPAMHRQDKYPFEPGLAEVSRQVHKDRSQRRHADGIAPREHVLPADVVGRECAEWNLREAKDGPFRSGSNRFGDARGDEFALIAVAIRR